jgi:hypothetical protein
MNDDCFLSIRAAAKAAFSYGGTRLRTAVLLAIFGLPISVLQSAEFIL